MSLVSDAMNDPSPMSTSLRHPGSQAQPTAHPSRKPWLRRIVIGFAGFVLVMAAIRLLWGLEADRRLRATLGEFRAAGQPVTVADIEAMLGDVEYGDNAAPMLIQAGEALAIPNPNEPSIDDYLNPDTVAASIDEVGRLLSANEAALSLFHQAVKRPKALWPPGFVAEAASPGAQYFSAQRHLAKLLSVEMHYEFQRGDHAAAIRSFHAGLRHADAINDHPTILHLMVGQAIEALYLSMLQDIVPILMVEGKQIGGVSDEVAPVRRAQIRDLIDHLMDENRPRDQAIGAALGGRALALFWHERARSLGRSAVTGPNNLLPDWVHSALFGPLYTLDRRQQMIGKSALHCAVSSPSWPEGRECLDEVNWKALPLERLLHPERYMFQFANKPMNLERNIAVLHFRRVAKRRLAATALAIRLYELDHTNRPAELSDLAADYLPVVPLDPFASDSAIQQAFTNAGHVLYSIGEDGVDDYGEDWGATLESRRNRRGDFVFYLDGNPRKWAPPNVPSPQTPNGDVEAEDGQRDNQKQYN